MYSTIFQLQYFFQIVKALSVRYEIVTANASVQSSFSEANILDYIVDLRPYGMNSVLTKSFIFEVKACHQVLLYLSSSDRCDSSKPLYEITIGSHLNSGLQIRRRDDASLHPSSIVTQIFNTPNIVSCTDYKPFWITWEAGNIMVGSGNVVHNSVRANWKDQDPFKVKCFGVTTLADVVGHWKLYIPVKDNFTGYFNNCQDPDKRAVLLSLGVVSSTKLGCAMLCSQLNTCAVFNYHDQDKSCEPLSFGMDPITDFPTVIAPGWEYFTKCYEGTEECVGCFF